MPRATPLVERGPGPLCLAVLLCALLTAVTVTVTAAAEPTSSLTVTASTTRARILFHSTADCSGSPHDVRAATVGVCEGVGEAGNRVRSGSSSTASRASRSGRATVGHWSLVTSWPTRGRARSHSACSNVAPLFGSNE